MRLKKVKKVPLPPSSAIPTCACTDPAKPSGYRYGYSYGQSHGSSGNFKSNSSKGSCDLKDYHDTLKVSAADQALFAKLKRHSASFKAAAGDAASFSSSSSSATSMDLEATQAPPPPSSSFTSTCTSASAPASATSVPKPTAAKAWAPPAGADVIDLTL